MNRFAESNNLDSDRLLYELRHIRAIRVVSKTSRSVIIALDGEFITSFLLTTTRENNPKTIKEYKRYIEDICEVDGIQDGGACDQIKEFKIVMDSDRIPYSFNMAYHSAQPIVGHHSAESDIHNYPKRMHLFNKRNGRKYTFIRL